VRVPEVCVGTQGGWQDAIDQRLDEVRGRVSSLEGRHADILAGAEWTSNDDEHDPEGATVAFERAQVAGLLHQAKRELGELTEAQARLDAGTYGVCERCGQPIGDGRLEALPAATRCIRCV
jgi:RNA polymerase-binding transcription factor DksA